MDMMAMVTSMLAMQAGNTQTQIATTIMASNNAAQKSDVQTLLGMGQSGGSSLANVGAGIGGNLDISA
jgi:hypothetical protein